jgi:hypothetical protein
MCGLALLQRQLSSHQQCLVMAVVPEILLILNQNSVERVSASDEVLVGYRFTHRW